MVRLYKLLNGLLDQTCQKRRETSFIFARLIFETVVNLRFLIKHLSDDLVASYISYSLQHERKLRDVIRENISSNGGAASPIETRMLRSIETAESASGISLDSIGTKRLPHWGGKNTYDKSADVGLESAYLALFGGGSHGIHGNWQELYGEHLDWDGQGFTPRLKWGRPRPQILLSLAVILTDTLIIFFEFIDDKQALESLRPSLQSLQQRLLQVDDAHESYLSELTRPGL